MQLPTLKAAGNIPVGLPKSPQRAVLLHGATAQTNDTATHLPLAADFCKVRQFSGAQT
ncbi:MULTISPECIES: hypothetical protein [unclassified Undibacterium]|uniref:hypothetical protein n=1 Tax=unclassified Undibacterium TaxID=2630295 RepID=UPI002AC8B5A0|nr:MULTISPECIES: hypothetical protein [unclassified Undibacterium]MEB0139294.1 hypothetical protein [Undibacterium sp. CCC2.1]MEB0172138.1 hypothetical protein [Undibacterium sp. CCC1.1]MEB0176071.1 hypothetical protein [Undibacterium sp. CCC3.4]MEB0215383.1 hypothetical protein [Undibacterium sp. 5I2]WPX43456.1 hypothetical protein RHM61_19125 [Undibacterium sp. CCC3.4]